GDRMAARAKATARGMAGIIQWIRKPSPRTVKTTSPKANSRITTRSRNSASLGMRQPSTNSSGGRNSRKKTSGFRSTDSPVISTTPAPSAICTRGRAMRVMRATHPDSTTASSRKRMVSIRCMTGSVDHVRIQPSKSPQRGGMQSNRQMDPAVVIRLTPRHTAVGVEPRQQVAAMRFDLKLCLGVVVDQGGDGVAERLDPLACPGRHSHRRSLARQTFGLTQHGLARVRLHQVDLVPDLQDAARLALGARYLLQHRLDVLGLGGA